MFPKTCHKTTKQTKQKKHHTAYTITPYRRYPYCTHHEPIASHFCTTISDLLLRTQLPPPRSIINIVATINAVRHMRTRRSVFIFCIYYTVNARRCIKFSLQAGIKFSGRNTRQGPSISERRIVVEAGRQSLGEISNEGQSEKKWETCIQHRR